ncbi:glycosyl hydrolase family 18 protein [Modestobacter lapidis]
MALWAAAVVAVLGVAAGIVVLRPVVLPGPHTLVAAAWLPTADPRAGGSLPPALDAGVTEVSPTLASFTADGGVAVQQPAPEVQALLERPDVRVIPTVQNYLDGGWQGGLVAEVLADPGKADAHRRELVRTAVQHEWDGLDIDYEALPPTAGPVFTDFLDQLADDLHAEGMRLTVAVPARVNDQDEWGLAYSYQVLGQIADEVRVMTYDHSWSTSEAGPVAPLEWVRGVITYATQRVPAEKLMLGLATYGYDWVGQQGTTLQATDAVELARRVGATPEWVPRSASWTFSYEQDGVQHTVWYEDARSLAAKQQLAIDAELRGVAIWALGGEDPELWTSVAAATRGSAA